MSVRGYAPWKPKAEAIYWVRSTIEVLNEFRDYWPLSVRQLFYRLVATYDYEKTEEAYSKLTQILSRARRAGMLPWESIRDGGQGKAIGAFFYEGHDDFLKKQRQAARYMMLDRQRGQENVIELWCEAGGMVPILRDIAAPYSARVNAGGGYDSVTGKHNLATRTLRRAALDGRKTVILHVGDFDGSGEDMANVLREDAGLMAKQLILAALDDAGHRKLTTENGKLLERFEDAYGDAQILNEAGTHYTKEATRFASGWLTIERVALTGEQVVERNVITAPAKRSDSRTKEFIRRNDWVVDELGTTDISAQLEALTPPELEALLRETIEGHLDMDKYEEVLADEDDIRGPLLKALSELDGREDPEWDEEDDDE